MSFTTKVLGFAAVAAASIAFTGAAKADVCNTPSALSADLGKFEGEVITIAGSMQGKDEENLLATVSRFEAKQLAQLLNIQVQETLQDLSLLTFSQTMHQTLLSSHSQVWQVIWQKKVIYLLLVAT